VSRTCNAGQRWSWDGVEFRVLHPVVTPAGVPAPVGRAPIRKSNDMSCVLRVATASWSALLTGDIEAKSELELLRREPQLDVHLLLVPHHGSRTSSTPDFIDAVAPTVGLVSVAYKSRFRHPNVSVVARYGAREIVLRRTDREGALHAVLPAQADRVPTIEPHASEVRYWSDRRPP
jgi:competence protein ComEC